MTKFVSPQELRASSEPTQVVDVRSPQEYAEGHIPGAMNIPLEELVARTADLQPGSRVVLVCQSGQRAEMACAVLEGLVDSLQVLEGGTEAWMRAGWDTVAVTAKRLPIMRQVHLVAGCLLLLSTALAFIVDLRWMWLAGLVGCGLTVAGATGWCGMALLLARMPWNKARKGNSAQKLRGA